MALLNKQSAAQYSALMQQTVQMVSEWVETQALYTGGAPETMAAATELRVSAEGIGAQAALARMEEMFLPRCIATANTASLAHLHPPTLLVGQLAEVLIAGTNQSLDSWNQSPAATFMEQHVIHWLGARCGFGKNSNGVFTSGGTQSNLMGLLLARDEYYARQQVDVQQVGMMAQSAGVILCSDQAHFSIEKNAGLLGLGRQAVIKVATDAQGAMLVSDLQAQIMALRQRGQAVMAVVATAGTTDSGAIDPLIDIAKICRADEIWLHVDAAWGGALLLSTHHRSLIDGIALADSITLDFHKHFFLPISCGAFLIRDQRYFESMRHHSDYLNPTDDEADAIPNLVTKSLQTTRRFDALKLWMALEALGTARYGALIDQCLDSAQQAARQIKAHADLVLVTTPVLSSVLFYFEPADHPTDNPADRGSSDINTNTEGTLTTAQRVRLNRRIAQQLLHNNIANIATTQYQSVFCLKLTILNPEVTEHTITEVLAEVCRMGQQLLSISYHKDAHHDHALSC